MVQRKICRADTELRSSSQDTTSRDVGAIAPRNRWSAGEPWV